MKSESRYLLLINKINNSVEIKQILLEQNKDFYETIQSLENLEDLDKNIEEETFINFRPYTQCFFYSISNNSVNVDQLKQSINLCMNAHELVGIINDLNIGYKKETCDQFKLLSNYNNILFLGPIGAGKSTLISSLIGNPLLLYRIDDGIILINDPESKKYDIKIGIGHEQGTTAIKIYCGDEGYDKKCYIDGPGLNDISIHQRIRNSLEYQRLLECSQNKELKVKIEFVIPTQSVFDTERFQALPKFFQDLEGLIPDILDVDSKFSNSVFIFSRGLRHQKPLNIKNKIKKITNDVKRSLEPKLTQVLNKLVEEAEDRITIFPTPQQDGHEDVEMEVINSEWQYKDPEWYNIQRIIDKQPALSITPRDFDIIINDDEVIQKEIEFYQHSISQEIKEKHSELDIQIKAVRKESVSNFSLECVKLLYQYLSVGYVRSKTSKFIEVFGSEQELIEVVTNVFNTYNKTKNILKTLESRPAELPPPASRKTARKPLSLYGFH